MEPKTRLIGGIEIRQAIDDITQIGDDGLRSKVW